MGGLLKRVGYICVGLFLGSVGTFLALVHYYATGRVVGRKQGRGETIELFADALENGGDIEGARALRSWALQYRRLPTRLDSIADRFEEAAFQRHQERLTRDAGDDESKP